MKRRTLLTGAATVALAPQSLAQPAVGGKARTLIYVPQANLTSLDPVWTTAVVTRVCGAMIFETLYGRDENLNPKPQMIEGHQVDNNGLRWTMRLREGLLFHDGTPVLALARDCVASLLRWMKRGPIGQSITGRMDALEAPNDRTIVFRLNKPFAALPYALAKTQPTPVIMPERLAQTDPFKQVPEALGSGPFRFVANEYVPGSLAVFARFDRYNPRPEPASFAAGGYRVLVDRVEWRIIPDSATAANALATGEVDWLDAPLPDLLPVLRKASGVVVGPIDIYGSFGGLRPNHLQGPTANAGIRRAMLAAIDQVEVMTAVMGDETDLYRAPVGFFLPGKPSANDAGMDAVRKRHSTDEIKVMLKQAGYGGERVVLMHPTDQVFYNAMSSVVASSLRRVGINLDEQSLDWGTVVQRRTSREPLDKGGWSLFPYGAPAAEYGSPVFATNLRGSGKNAWFGWPSDEMMEAMHMAWIDSNDEGERKRLDAAIQARAFESVPFIPLGQYMPPAAWRSNLSGLLKGAQPVFWNVQKA
jgi:peptide/nickel transport system substrate-binding protein